MALKNTSGHAPLKKILPTLAITKSIRHYLPGTITPRKIPFSFCDMPVRGNLFKSWGDANAAFSPALQLQMLEARSGFWIKWMASVFICCFDTRRKSCPMVLISSEDINCT